MLGLIWVQTVCKGYQANETSRQRDNTGITEIYNENQSSVLCHTGRILSLELTL